MANPSWLRKLLLTTATLLLAGGLLLEGTCRAHPQARWAAVNATIRVGCGARSSGWRSCVSAPSVMLLMQWHR